MAQLFVLPQQVRVNSAGTPYANSEAYFYRASTLTAQTVYTTPALSVAHSQPVQADSAGQLPPIWLDPSAAYDYRVIVKTQSGSTLDDYTIARDIPVLSSEDIALSLDSLKRTAAEIAAGVTPSNYAYPEGDVRRYGGFLTGSTSAQNRAAIVTGLSIGGIVVRIPEGSFTISGAAITVPGGAVILGADGGNMQEPLTKLSRGSGDYSSFFITDTGETSFSGITIGHLKLSGGTSSNWSDVSSKWAITSHYPFTRIVAVHIEPATDYFGNGIRLHNDDSSGNGGSMGCWLSELDRVRFVGVIGTPAANGQLGLDMKINGGAVRVSRSVFEKTDACVWVRSGENITFDDVTLQSARSGDSAARTSAALIVGEANSSSLVKGLTFRGYIEGVGRAVLAQNVRGMKIFGSYINAFRSFSPSGGADGFIYLNKTCQGVVIDGNDIETQYNLAAAIYSEAPYRTSGNSIFVNVTNSDGVPQPYFGGGVFEGVQPSSDSDQTNLLTDASSTGAISNVSASGSLVQITDVAHGLSTGDRVWIEGIVGTVGNDVTNLRLWRITRVDADNFTLDGSLHSGTYTSGGNWWLPTVRTGAESGEFTGTLTGCTTSPTGTITWVRSGRIVSMTIPTLTATSNTTACTITGLPAYLMPAAIKRAITRAVDSGTGSFSIATFDPGTAGTISLGYGVSGGVFTNSGTKGHTVTTVTYSLE